MKEKEEQIKKQKGKELSRKEGARKKRKRKDIITTIILIIAAGVFVFSLFMLVDSILPYFSGGQEYDEVKSLVITQEKVETDEGEVEEVFRVDFELLKEQNADTVAWIRFDEPAVISYPVVKSHDNNEYLTRTFSANDNKLGSIFMDMNTNTDFSDRNTIIYGHNMKIGGEMFSQLNEYAEESFCKKYPYFYIYTPDGRELTYQVFSAGVVKDTAGNYKNTFASDEEFLEYLTLCQDSSNYSVDAELNADSKVVTLSTCTNVRDDERFILQGVQIESKQN